ncbi:MAG: hypothetical protein ABEH66_04560 [Halobacteriales archaeon]
MSAVIGFILMFGILIVGWSIYQGFVIPDQNENTEFEHNRKAQTQLLNVKDAVLRTGSTGVPQSVTVQVGAEYARRNLGVNLGITGGAIRTRNTTDDGRNRLILDNVTALDGETKDYISDNVTVQTKSLVYEPIYSNYKGAPQTVITGGAAAVINERTQVGFDAYNFSIADQVAIKGQTITVVSIAGNLSKSVGGQSSSITVDTEALSVAERSVSIKKRSGTTNITLSIPTQIKDQSVWKDSAGFGSATAVKNVSRNGDRINVTLKAQQYTLRMLKVGVGSGASEPGAEYITDSDTPESVAESTSVDLSYAVRDAFNNPKSAVRVKASLQAIATPNGTTGTTNTLTVKGTSESTTAQGAWINGTTSDGQFVLNYTAPDVDSTQTVRVNVTILDNSSTKENVSTTFSVFDADGSGVSGGGGGGAANSTTADDINPNDGTTVLLTGSVVRSETSPMRIEAQFENQDSSTSRNITSVRVAFVFIGSQSSGTGGNPVVPVAVANITQDPNGGSANESFIKSTETGTNIPTGFMDVRTNRGIISAGGDINLDVFFDSNADLNSQNGFFILGLKFEDGGQGTYFVKMDP